MGKKKIYVNKTKAKAESVHIQKVVNKSKTAIRIDLICYIL